MRRTWFLTSLWLIGRPDVPKDNCQACYLEFDLDDLVWCSTCGNLDSYTCKSCAFTDESYRHNNYSLTRQQLYRCHECRRVIGEPGDDWTV